LKAENASKYVCGRGCAPDPRCLGERSASQLDLWEEEGGEDRGWRKIGGKMRRGEMRGGARRGGARTGGGKVGPASKNPGYGPESTHTLV